MESSHSYFQNTNCEYYPCHKGLEDFNCLFCYCPLYTKDKCSGNPRDITIEDKTIKDCSNCLFPHRPENYDKVIKLLQQE